MNIKHMEGGPRRTKEYRAWEAMKRRCEDPKYWYYRNYGGRGITVCADWQEDYIKFLTDMGRAPSPQHSLDRIDGTKGYSPSNCRWSTPDEQSRNTRTNRFITLDGETHCLIDWIRLRGLAPRTVAGRLQRGWTEEQALSPANIKYRPSRRIGA